MDGKWLNALQLVGKTKKQTMGNEMGGPFNVIIALSSV